jgi:homoserine dehydrogenase
MHGQRLIVLKFGGSVLRTEETLQLAVHEIYRWRREGYGVVAVVSAFAGETDALLRKSRQICGSAEPASVAALAATGELRSAALLGLHLDHAGISVRVLSPSALHLIAEGDPLDATPVECDPRPLRSGLAREGVVVVPGYVAQDRDGRTVVLGRGGSDLTALFLAHQLRPCRCRLIKDVDGLYERDPAAGGPPPPRYTRATWDDALATDGSIIQHKAIRFAKAQGLSFELGGFNGTTPTYIGGRSTILGEPERRHPKLCVSLLGFGTVGGGVYELLRAMPNLFDITAIAVRNLIKERQPEPPRSLLTTDPFTAATCGVDIVVEAIGGLEPAATAVEAALRSGASVVTANKALLAHAGPWLRSLAESEDQPLRFSAAVGGSMPIVEALKRTLPGEVRQIRAVLNGTTNFVLDRMAAGISFNDAVTEAQHFGFAEREPRRDLSGNDAADKLCVLADAVGIPGFSRSKVMCDELTAERVSEIRSCAGKPAVIRQVAILTVAGESTTASVQLVPLDPDDPLATAKAEHNIALIELADGSTVTLRGRGAGRRPTAEAVLADLLEFARARADRPAASTDVREQRSATVAA